MKLGIVGGGRAAWAFGSAWKQIGWKLSGLNVRSDSGVIKSLGTRALDLSDLVGQSEVVLVAVTDSALPDVAREAAKLAPSETMLFHPSGSTSSEVFAPHQRAFSLHPLRSLPAVGQPVDLRGTLFTFEGAEDSRDLARDFVRLIGGNFAEIRSDQKALYHAAAVFASNYVEALLEIASNLLQQAGVEQDVRNELATLAQSAIENWLRGEFTGPVSRGDRALIERHLQALAADQDRAEIYRLLAGEIAKALQRKSF